MSVTTELWANPAATPATVAAAQTAVAQGTSQNWTMSGGYASFPAASSSGGPPTQFHVIDPAQPGEIIAVTNVSGSTWTVTRGAESTATAAHAAGFTVQQVATAGGMTQFLQGPPSQDGLALGTDQVNSSLLTVSNSSTVTAIASMAVAAGEAVAGSMYEIEAWGSYSTASTAPTLTFTVSWGGVSLGSQTFTMGSSVSVARWKFKCSASILPGPLAGASCRLELASSGTASTAVGVYLWGANASSGVSITTSSSELFELTVNWNTASSSNSLYVLGGKAWKSA
jgi:hypothetical protein